MRAVIYTFECPECGTINRDFNILLERHDRCASGKRPLWVLKDIYVEGIDPTPEWRTKSS